VKDINAIHLVFSHIVQVTGKWWQSFTWWCHTRTGQWSTSTYAGIVHHLSVPSGRALTQTVHQRFMVGRCCCLRLASITFITRIGFSTGTLARTLDSLVRVSRRAGKDHFDRIAQSPSGQKNTNYSKLPVNKPDLKSLCILSTPFGLKMQHKSIVSI